MKKLSTFCVMALVAIGTYAGPAYLVQATYEGTEPTWSQETVDATGATLVDLAETGATLDAFMGTVGNKEVWVIEGMYFWLAERAGGALTMYGGFAGTEKSVDEREVVDGGKPWEFVHPTIISGEDEFGDPYAHFTSNTGQSFILDGITFTKFSDKGAGTTSVYGGFSRIHNGAVVNACQFIDIHAYKKTGGVFDGYNDNGCVVSNCLFENCTSGDLSAAGQTNMQGGALRFAPGNNMGNTVDNCEFRKCGVYNPAANCGGAIYGHSNGYVNVSNCVFDSCFVSSLSGKGAGSAVCVCSSASGSKIYNNLFTRCTDSGNNKAILFVGGGNAKDDSEMVSYIMHNTFAKNESNAGVAFQSNGNMICKNNIFGSPSAVYVNKPDNYYKVFANNIYSGGNMTGVTAENNKLIKAVDVGTLFVDYENNNFMPVEELQTLGDNGVVAQLPDVATDLLGVAREAFTPGCYEFVKEQPSALSHVAAVKGVAKWVKNGQVFVVREGIVYDMLGSIAK